MSSKMKKNSSKNKKSGRDAMSANEQKFKAATKLLNKDFKKNAKVIGRSNVRAGTDLIKNVRGRMHPDSALALWTRTLARPFDEYGIFCPVNYNPAPSFIQSTARTTVTQLSMQVAAGTTTQMVLMPGHGPALPLAAAQNGGDNMDAVSYHGWDQYVGGVLAGNHYVVGPMAKTDSVATRTPIIGWIVTTLTPGTMNSTSSSANASPLTYDVPLPYTSTGTTGSHSRWQLVSMGIRINNITAELTRGASVISVQPNNTTALVDNAQQGTLEVYPTFHDWGNAGDRGIEISWIPRAQDLAFWHSNGGGATANFNTNAPGLVIFFNAIANTQIFTYEIVCNWQLAGTYLNAIGGPAMHHPELKPVVEKTVSNLLNTSHTAAAAPRVAAASTANDGMSVAETALHIVNGVRRVAQVAGAVAHAFS